MHGGTSPLVLIDVGRWQSPQAFQEAIQGEGFRPVSEALRGFRPNPALYRVVRT